MPQRGMHPRYILAGAFIYEYMYNLLDQRTPTSQVCRPFFSCPNPILNTDP